MHLEVQLNPLKLPRFWVKSGDLLLKSAFFTNTPDLKWGLETEKSQTQFVHSNNQKILSKHDTFPESWISQRSLRFTGREADSCDSNGHGISHFHRSRDIDRSQNLLSLFQHITKPGLQIQIGDVHPTLKSCATHHFHRKCQLLLAVVESWIRISCQDFSSQEVESSNLAHHNLIKVPLPCIQSIQNSILRSQCQTKKTWCQPQPVSMTGKWKVGQMKGKPEWFSYCWVDLGWYQDVNTCWDERWPPKPSLGIDESEMHLLHHLMHVCWSKSETFFKACNTQPLLTPNCIFLYPEMKTSLF